MKAKKNITLILVLLVVSIVAFSSCSKKTCPAYSMATTMRK
jgi:hypothetical protein